MSRHEIVDVWECERCGSGFSSTTAPLNYKRCPDCGWPDQTIMGDVVPGLRAQKRVMELEAENQRLRAAVQEMGALIFRTDLSQRDREERCGEIARQEANPTWLERQIQSAKEETDEWTEWKRQAMRAVLVGDGDEP